MKPHALRRTAANRVDVAARLSVRTTAACRLFPLGEALPSTTSAGSCLPLFSRFAGSMASSDFSSTYMLGVRLLAFPSRPGTRVRAWMRPPRFRAKNFSTCTRSPTARGSSHASHSPWDDVAFSSTERDRHLGIRPVSQLNTWPVVSPVNASRRPSRDAAHHSGSGRLARPSPWGTFTSYSLPASWRTPFRSQNLVRYGRASSDFAGRLGFHPSSCRAHDSYFRSEIARSSPWKHLQTHTELPLRRASLSPID